MLVKISLPVLKWDERFSTIAVRRILLKGDVYKRRKFISLDNMASSYILQGVLDLLSKRN